ncbi:hypothetical protein ZTR_04373 [Talaromyces verruculosus]|nr:hypothetical protein ZTR_04373 [Talaromyces verruculosus]
MLLLSMDGGKEVVAKIPNPNAGLPGLVTSSEVTAMDFVRTQLHIPAPEVFDWCSKAANTAVGAEFIIMEKVPGIQLSQVWDQMEGLKKGPTTNRKYFDDGRGSLDIERGPWKSIEDYLAADAWREKESIVRLGDSSRLLGLSNAPGLYQTSKAAKFQALDSYMKIYKHILPRIETAHRPVLWHPDLHTNNIFVDREDPTKMTSVIDWECTHLTPMFLQVRRPALLDFDGPVPESFKLPKLPENFDKLNPQKQQDARKLRSAQMLPEMLYVVGILQNLGAYIGWDGFVSHADYNAMKELMDHLRAKFLEKMAETDEEREI